MIAYRRRKPWTPFDRRGNLRLAFSTDPWWKRLRAKLRGDQIWHRVGHLTEDQ